MCFNVLMSFKEGILVFCVTLLFLMEGFIKVLYDFLFYFLFLFINI